MGLEEQVPGGILLSTVEKVAGYVRKGSLWPATFGLACCAMEMMAVGASKFDIMRYIILPMSKSGIALGAIFVVSIVMGDFFVVKVMSGGGTASVVGAFYEDIGVLQYPSAAASAIVLTILVMLMVALILRVVDIRKEITQ